VCFVGVRCDLAVLEARELARGDRLPNLARPQHAVVHAGPRRYDLEVDTGTAGPHELAATIVEATRRNPRPGSFDRLRAELGVAPAPPLTARTRTRS
jgi:chloramphenicol 3-O phosphotransferase